MKKVWNMIQIVFAAAGGSVGWFLGGCDGLLRALVIFIAVDYVTGVLCAVADHRLSSEIGFRGICRKVLVFVMVGIGHVIDESVIGGGSMLRTAVLSFYLSNEGISLLENATHLGLPVPERLKDVLEQLHDRTDKKSDK